MIDISDGLVSDLSHIAKASGVSINIKTAEFDIPEPLAAAASAFNGDALEWILTGGEDHAFAATFKTALDVPSGWIIIGSVTSGEPNVTVDGEIYSGKGWDHFSTN
jgi:thiamine-monophosphate kinase